MIFTESIMNISARRIFFSGFGFWLAIAALALYTLLPLRKNLKYGIDLVGGTYITLEVQTEKAIEDALQRKMRSFGSKFEKAGISAATSQKVTADSIVLTFTSLNDVREAAKLLKEQERELKQSTQGTTLTLSLTKAEQKKIAEWAVQGNIEVLRTRLDRMSVSEIPIAAQGERNIVIELPDVDDPEKAKAMIGKPAVLEFKVVERTGMSEEELLDEYDGMLPEDLVIVPGKERDEFGNRRYYLLPTFTDITGALLKDARAGFGGEASTQLAVSFEFMPEGGEKFYELTRANIGKQIAIVLDGQVISAPVVNTAISSHGQITGRFTSQEVNELAALLKSGAFVAPVTFEEERRIGPALGAESIRQGLMSCLIGLGLLLVFSLFYYKVAGLFAFIALLFNLLLILFILSRFHATLTLPGIAGMVLTTGMAIDASILIYERIKEELKSGMNFHNALKAGFSNAMVVILDANITTFIVGVVLFKFGTGPIQGYAVTLLIGIIATLITGLFFLRSLFNVALDGFGFKSVKM